jgi:hypothetical protein
MARRRRRRELGQRSSTPGCAQLPAASGDFKLYHCRTDCGGTLHIVRENCAAELSGKGKGGGGGEDPGALDPRALADGGAKSFGWLAGARRAYGSGAMRVLQPKVPGRKAGEGA